MKILHTSDWHIGRALYGRKRYAEHEAFLAWLADLVEREEVDALLVAGDVFDSNAPSNRAQGLYYRFLCRVAARPQRQVVVTAGNHDSPSFLDAPRELLKFLNVHVVGAAAEDPAEEVIVLPGPDGKPGLIVCAVPYLRDRDIRTAEAGESVADKDIKIVEGIRDHYRKVGALAAQRRAALERPVPIVSLGHLFTAGGQAGEGVRELYIGSLAQVGTDVFPDCIDYLALGHLHVPQKVGGSELRRYSGAPLPIGFGEAGQQKEVVLVEFADSTTGDINAVGARDAACIAEDNNPAAFPDPGYGAGDNNSAAIPDPATLNAGTPATVTPIPVPCFQELQSLRGDWPALESAIEELKARASTAWLEIVYEGEAVAASLREWLDEAVAGSGLEILRVRNNRVLELALQRMEVDEVLDDLDVTEVFQRCLEAHVVPQEQQIELLGAFREVLVDLAEDDPRAD